MFIVSLYASLLIDANYRFIATMVDPILRIGHESNYPYFFIHI